MDVKLLLGIAAAATFASCSCSDSRCNVENCNTLLNTCRVELYGEPSGAVLVACIKQFGEPDAGTDFSEYCVQACNAGGSGALVACVAANPACGSALDGGQAAATMMCEGPDTGTFDQTCFDKCDADRKTCETACPSKANFQACMDCGSTCGLTATSCSKACG